MHSLAKKKVRISPSSPDTTALQPATDLIRSAKTRIQPGSAQCSWLLCFCKEGEVETTRVHHTSRGSCCVIPRLRTEFKRSHCRGVGNSINLTSVMGMSLDDIGKEGEAVRVNRSTSRNWAAERDHYPMSVLQQCHGLQLRYR